MRAIQKVSAISFLPAVGTSSLWEYQWNECLRITGQLWQMQNAQDTHHMNQ